MKGANPFVVSILNVFEHLFSKGLVKRLLREEARSLHCIGFVFVALVKPAK